MTEHHPGFLAFGTWKADPKLLPQAIDTALSVGYRHFDCAPVYQNEAVVGQALTTSRKKHGVLREKLWITSKLWNTCHAPDLVEPCCKQTIKDLQCDYLDLYLIHWPHAFEETSDPTSRDAEMLFPKNANGAMRYSDTSYLDTWKAMEKLVEKGLVNHIGLSNFNQQQIEDVLKVCTIKPYALQCESNLYFNNHELFLWTRKQGIFTMSYCPLGSGNQRMLEEPVLQQLAKKHYKTPAQIALVWQLHNSNIVIPKSTTPARIRENFCVELFLTPREVNRLNGLCKNERTVNLERDKGHKDYPF